MAVQAGVAYVDIKPDLRGFGRELRTGVSRDMKGAMDETSRSLKTSMVGMGRSMATTFAAGFAAVGIKNLIGGAVGKASELHEVVSTSRMVFGSAFEAMDRWARGAAQSLGLSHRAALEAAMGFGNLFSQVGIGIDRSAEMSRRLVEVGVDFRSAYGGDSEQVVNAISSAFRGEYDALQRVIPTISATAVEQRALTDSGKASAKQLTAQEKAAGTYAFILDHLGAAEGDRARTAESLANQQESLNAEWENAQAALGKGLMPVMVSFAELLNDTVLPAMQTLFLSSGADATGWAATLRDAMGDVAGFILGAFREIAGGLATFFEAIPGGWGEGFADDLKAGVAGMDEARVRLHATTGELLAWNSATAVAAKSTAAALSPIKALGDATTATAKATRDAASADRDLEGAQRHLADLLRRGAVDEEKIAEARERLAEATRSLNSANRRLADVQEDYNEALNVANLLGTDTALEALEDASDNLADAQDGVADAAAREKDAQKALNAARAGDPEFNEKVADAKDRVADAQDKVNEAETAAVAATAGFVGGVKAREDAVRALNGELAKYAPLAWNVAGPLAPGQTRGPAPLAPGVAGPLAPGQERLAGPALPTTTKNVVINNTFNEKMDPGLLGKAIAWQI